MKKIEIEQIGERLKEIRLAHNMTAPDFANSLEVAKTSLYYYEKGERIPDALALLRLHEKYVININWLLTGEGGMSYLSQQENLSANESILLSYFKGLTPEAQGYLVKLLMSV